MKATTTLRAYNSEPRVVYEALAKKLGKALSMRFVHFQFQQRRWVTRRKVARAAMAWIPLASYLLSRPALPSQALLRKERLHRDRRRSIPCACAFVSMRRHVHRSVHVEELTARRRSGSFNHFRPVMKATVTARARVLSITRRGCAPGGYGAYGQSQVAGVKLRRGTR